jgi:hypothetical protein
VPLLKERADVVTRGDHGEGVIELIGRLLADDLRSLKARAGRHQVLLGVRDDGQEVMLPTYGPTVLFAGPSESGKSTAATGMVERLADKGYQFCLIDPEGDYESFGGGVVLGSIERPPSVDEVVDVLANPDDSVIVNLLNVRLSDRPAYLASLLPRLSRLRAKVGRPHWLVIDEAHHVLPSDESTTALVGARLESAILVTLQPRHLAGHVLRAVDTLVAVGADSDSTVRDFARAVGVPSPSVPKLQPDNVNALVWLRQTTLTPFPLQVALPHAEHRRHRRKYADGDLGENNSFFFRGPNDELNLRAQNLTMFSQLAEGVDDATWLFHLRRGDYSRWFHAAIKDESLARLATSVEQNRALTPAESRARIVAAIEERYTLPA